ncbi:MAG: hypothetical protein J6Y74_02950 [Clostridia bacterium]|nr:hypothetical protein [Clostridia bacterium]
MIGVLKKANPYLLLFLTGAAYWFSKVAYTFSIASMAAETMGMNHTTFLITMSVVMVLFSAFLAKVLVYLSYRIVGVIFTRRSGMLYPFPLRYGEYSGIVLSFSFLCLMLCGLIGLPELFIPALSSVLGVIKTLVVWVFYFIGSKYFVDRFAHDYDRKALATALSVVPFALMGVTILLAVLEVAL